MPTVAAIRSALAIGNGAKEQKQAANFHDQIDRNQS